MQSRDPPERERVLINVDETNVRLVPEEGRGYVSKRAYRLFVEGVPVGRRASLSALISTITHVAAICDKPDFQKLLPQVVLVGENPVTEARFAALRLTSPESAHIWRYQAGWMASAIMVQYVRPHGAVSQGLPCTPPIHSLMRCALGSHQSSRSARGVRCRFVCVCVIPG